MSWDESLKNGEKGEYIIWNWLTKQSWCANVVDLRQAKKFRDMDVDFLTFCNNKQAFFFEVKTDYLAHSTGNIIYETSTSGNKGCFAKTEADFILYYLPITEELLMIDVKLLREYVKNANLEEIPMGDNAKGYLIDIDKLMDSKVIYKKYEGVA